MIPLNYSLRSLLRRPLTVLVTVLGLSIVTMVFAAVLMLARGVEETLAKNGSPANILALRDGATSEATSILSRDQVRLFAAQPDIALGEGGRPLVDGEVATIGAFERSDGSGAGNVLIRGVGPMARAVRPTVVVTEGRAPNQGTSEVMIGKDFVGRFKHFALGDHLTFARRDWQVVGVFSADGAAFQSEIWADADQIMDAFSRPIYDEVVGRLKDPGLLTALQAKIAADPQLSTLKIWREDTFFESQSESLRRFITVLGVFVAVIFAIAAALGAAITMYAQVAGRIREVGTLRAIGFRRRAVLAAFLQESVVLSLVGAILGIAIASALSLVSFTTSNQDSFTEVTFRFRFAPGIIVASLIFALVMGLLGGFSPAWRASRLSIVSATRG